MKKAHLLFLLIVFVTTFTAPALVAQDKPLGATPFNGGLYRTVNDNQVITLVSNDELELRTQAGNFLCKYTKQNDKLRVVAQILGTTQVIYYRITDEGLQNDEGIFLYNPVKYAIAKRAIMANLKQEQDAKRMTEEGRQEKLIVSRKTLTDYFSPGSAFTIKQDVNGKSETSTGIVVAGATSEKQFPQPNSAPVWNWNGVVWTGGSKFSFSGYFYAELWPNGRVVENVRVRVASGVEYVGFLVNGNFVGQYPSFGELHLTKLPESEAREIEAKRITEEKRANEEKQQMLANATKLIIGTWRDDKREFLGSSYWTFNADGTTLRTSPYYEEIKDTWSIDGEIITMQLVKQGGRAFENGPIYRAKILELTDSKLKMKEMPNGAERSATKFDAAKMIIGTWRRPTDVVTYNADGTRFYKGDDGRTGKAKWSIVGDTLSLTVTEDNGKAITNGSVGRARIVEITNEKYTSKNLQDGKELQATRVK